MALRMRNAVARLIQLYEFKSISKDRLADSYTVLLSLIVHMWQYGIINRSEEENCYNELSILREYLIDNKLV